MRRKTVLKTVISVALLIVLCFSLTSCRHFLYKWNPCEQPGTYWESTDSTVSFRIWEENDSDPYYAFVKHYQEEYGISDFDYIGRGSIVYNGETYEVLVYNPYEGEGIWFYTLNVLDITAKSFYMMSDNEEELKSIVEFKANNEPEEFFFVWALELNYKSSFRSVGTDIMLPEKSQRRQLVFGTEVDLRRID